MRNIPKNRLTIIETGIDSQSTAANIILNVTITMPEDTAEAIVHVQHRELYLVKMVLNGAAMPPQLLESLGWDNGVMSDVHDVVTVKAGLYHEWWLGEHELHRQRIAEQEEADFADQIALEHSDNAERMRSF